MKDPLNNLVQLKTLEEIIAAARETIHRHRRRFLQRNLRPCPENCKGATMLGHKVVGCGNCGSLNGGECIKENKFVPLFTKEELAKQFADQLRDPEILVREYRDVTVFLWVLGAFDKQKKTLDKAIVEGVEQREKSKSVAVGNGDSGAAGPDRVSELRDPATEIGTGETAPNSDRQPNAAGQAISTDGSDDRSS